MSGESWYTETADVLSHLAASLIPVEKLITGASYLLGLVFAIKAVLTLKTHGEQRSSLSGTGNMKESGVYLLVAGMLLYYPTAFEVIMNSTFGYDSVLAYVPSGSAADGMVGQSVVTIVQVVGLIAFVRGWLLIARGASQGQAAGGTGKGMMHVFGGVLAMNIVGTLEVFRNTLFGG